MLYYNKVTRIIPTGPSSISVVLNIGYILNETDRCSYVHLKNLFLVDLVTLLYTDEVIGNGNHISLYTNAKIDIRGSHMSLEKG